MRLILILVIAANILAAEQAPWARLADASRLAAKDPSEARIQLEALVLEHPDFLPARFNLGTLLLESDAARAADHLQAATAHPGSALAADAWHNLALARWKQGKLDDAVAAAQRALAINDQDVDYRRTYDELRRAWLVHADELRRKKEAAAKILRLPPQDLVPAREGEAYSTQITAGGGTPPYRFASDSLPEGLVLSAEGHISGTPAAKTRGQHTLAITLTDAAAGSVRGDLTLTILPAPAVTTTMLPPALLNTPYTTTLTCEGIDRPTWTVEGLPPGLSADPSGTIRGTAPTSGQSTLRIRVSDGTRNATATLPLTVVDGVLPDPVMLPPATAWAPYEHRMTVRGPRDRYTWQHEAAEAGVQVDREGRISGTPERAGEITPTLSILNASGTRWQGTVHLHVNPPPVIGLEDTLSLRRGDAINRRIPLDGGTPPFTWSGSGGPTGVRVDPDGFLRGAPDLAGESNLVVTVRDRWQATSQITVKVTVEEADPEQDGENDPDQQPNQGEQDQGMQDQQGEQQQENGQQQDGQQGQNQEQQGQNQEQQAAEAEQQGKDPAEDGKDPAAQPDAGDTQRPNAPDPAQAQDAAKDGTEPRAGDQQGQVLNLSREAAERWLEHLEAEDHEALRQQLLPRKRPAQSKEPW